MKKLIAVFLSALLIFSLAACSGGSSTKTTTAAPDTSSSSGDTTTSPQPTTVAPAATAAAKENAKDGDVSGGENAPPTILNSMEYTLYMNIFYNKQGEDYTGQQVTKKGTFATIEDRYGEVTRYYVWGYNDATKCCDWQWELVPKDTKNLPANGDLITVTGTFEGDAAALDGYWITDAEITVEQEYDGPDEDYDLSTMGATLERVQVLNMQAFPDYFNGKTIRLYGRVLNPSCIQNPYYNDSWNQDFITEDEVPAIGTCVIVSGTFNGVIENAKVSVTTDY